MRWEPTLFLLKPALKLLEGASVSDRFKYLYPSSTYSFLQLTVLCFLQALHDVK